MIRAWCTALPVGIRLAVQIVPNAKKSEVVGLLDGVLKIRLQAQAIEGRANQALVHFIAAALGVPKRTVTITLGQTNKRKIIEIHDADLTVEKAALALLPSTAG